MAASLSLFCETIQPFDCSAFQIANDVDQAELARRRRESRLNRMSIAIESLADAL